MTVLGTVLSTTEVPNDRKVHEVSVEMLPLQHAGHLENFADNFGSGWLDKKYEQLRVQFNLIVLFDNAKIDAFWISMPGTDMQIALPLTCIPSPIIKQKHPQISWAEQSRFLVDETIGLSNLMTTSSKFELLAEVAGKREKIGNIHVRDACNGIHKHNGLSAASGSKGRVDAQTIRKKISIAALWVIERSRRVNRLLFLTVILPTLVATVYFGLLASDVYISESMFVVRSPQQQSDSPLGVMLKGAGFSNAQDDAYVLQNYIQSLDALKALDREFHLRDNFSDSTRDVFSRFPGLDWNDSFENFHLYYQKRIVDVELDTSSSITTLDTRAYTAEEAFRLNQRLLEMSEALVNQLNERSREDMIRFANREVSDAESKAKAALLALTQYRNEKGVIDPEKESIIPLQQIAKLQDELIATKVQIEQLKQVAKVNPALPILQNRVRFLENEIKVESVRVAGAGDRSLAGKAMEYQRLVVEKDFAEKWLASTMSTLEQARDAAQRQQLYLERIAQPSMPDVAMEPHRVRDIFAVFLIGLIVWGVLAMIIAGVREHLD